MPLLDLKDIKSNQFHNRRRKRRNNEKTTEEFPLRQRESFRKIIELETTGAELFFERCPFDIDDLMRIDGKGYINIIHRYSRQNQNYFPLHVESPCRDISANARERIQNSLN
jgi:hypothetical protein